MADRFLAGTLGLAMLAGVSLQPFTDVSGGSTLLPKYIGVHQDGLSFHAIKSDIAKMETDSRSFVREYFFRDESPFAAFSIDNLA